MLRTEPDTGQAALVDPVLEGVGLESAEVSSNHRSSAIIITLIDV